MDDLHPLTTPLAILSDPQLSDSPTQTLKVKQDDDSYSGRDYTITTNSSDSPLFTVKGKADRKHFQRNLQDPATGATLLEIRRSATGSWFVETPDPHRRTVVSGEMRMSFAHVKVDLKVSNAAHRHSGVGEVEGEGEASRGGEDVALELRGRDTRYQETDVLFADGGKLVARVSKVTGTTMPVIPFLNSNKRGKRDTWEVRVAGGVDVALVS